MSQPPVRPQFAGAIAAAAVVGLAFAAPGCAATSGSGQGGGRAQGELFPWTTARDVEAFVAEVDWANEEAVDGVLAFDDHRGTVIQVQSDLLFPQATTKIAAHAAQTVDVLATVLERFPDRRVVLESHIDATGDASAGLEKTRVRGAALRTALLARGVAGDRVTVAARGATAPRDTNETVEGRWKNRRIDVILVKPGG